MFNAIAKLRMRIASAEPLDAASEEFARFVRFGVAGLANTVVGFGIIAALDIGMHVRPVIANTAGYAVGIALSFVLNRHFVFRSRRAAKTSGPRFLISAAIAFTANLAVLAVAGQLLGDTAPYRLAAQALGMCVYTLTLFMFGRFWAFNE